MVEILKTCKTCNKQYYFDPIKSSVYMFDGCSRECSNTYFEKTGSGVVPNGIMLKVFVPKHLSLYG